MAPTIGPGAIPTCEDRGPAKGTDRRGAFQHLRGSGEILRERPFATARGGDCQRVADNGVAVSVAPFAEKSAIELTEAAMQAFQHLARPEQALAFGIGQAEALVQPVGVIARPKRQRGEAEDRVGMGQVLSDRAAKARTSPTPARMRSRKPDAATVSRVSAALRQTSSFSSSARTRSRESRARPPRADRACRASASGAPAVTPRGTGTGAGCAGSPRGCAGGVADEAHTPGGESAMPPT